MLRSTKTKADSRKLIAADEGGKYGDHGHGRIRGDVRAVPPYGPADVVQTGRGVRLHLRDGLGPLPPLDPRAGTERLRLVVAWLFGSHHILALRHRRYAARLPLPPGDHRPG